MFSKQRACCMSDADLTRLRDMLDMAQRVQRLLAGKSRDRLEADDMLLGLAVIRGLEVVGEAASKVSDDLKSTHPEIPWKQITGMRNYLIHAYMSVDFDIVWDSATQSIADLLPQLEAIIQSESDSDS